MPYETYAYFFVRGFEGPPESISTLLQLAPSQVWCKGDEWIKGKRVREFSNWQLNSPLPKAEPFQDSHILALVEILESRREAVLQALATYTCGLQGVGYYTDENPGFHLSSNLVSRVAALGLSIDFDLYCLCDHERPDA